MRRCPIEVKKLLEGVDDVPVLSRHGYHFGGCVHHRVLDIPFTARLHFLVQKSFVGSCHDERKEFQWPDSSLFVDKINRAPPTPPGVYHPPSPPIHINHVTCRGNVITAEEFQSPDQLRRTVHSRWISPLHQTRRAFNQGNKVSRRLHQGDLPMAATEHTINVLWFRVDISQLCFHVTRL